eukprot:4901678-Pyramimonas_sp.AAC.1
MHRSNNRDLVVSRRCSGKHAASLGPVAKEVDNDNGAALRNLRFHRGLPVATTFFDCGPTYDCMEDDRGRTRTIDLIAVPTWTLPHVR